MHDVIEQLGSDNFIGLVIGTVAVAGGLFLGLVAVIGHFTFEHRRLHIEASLKQQLIDRGMSADEIKGVLQASAAGKPRRGCWSKGRTHAARCDEA